MAGRTRPRDARRRLMTGALAGVGVAALTLVVVACTEPGSPIGEGTPVPVDAPMSELRRESILSFTFDGLNPDPVVELPADGQVNDTNMISRSYAATNADALAVACQNVYQRALANGWSGPSLEAKGETRFAYLSKSRKSLAIVCSANRSDDGLHHAFDLDLSIVYR